MMAQELNTEKGLKYFSYGFVLYMIALALLFIVLIALIVSIDEIAAIDEEQDPEEVLGPLVGFFAGLCLGGLFIFIAYILFLVGLIMIYSGRMEFGEIHANSVSKGTLFVGIGIIVSLVGGSIAGFLMGTIGSSVVGIVTAIFISLGTIYLIFEISDEKGKQMLWTGGILYVVVAIVSAAVIIWLFLYLDLIDVGTGTEDVNAITPALLIPLAVGSIALIPILIFYMAYRRAYWRVKNREIQPLPPLYPQPFAGPYPPGYPPGHPGYPPYPGPYQPYPPYQPPPYQPPQQPIEQPGEVAQPVATPGTPVQPQAATPEPIRIKNCPHCGTQIPIGSTVCPVCKKEMKP
ncbi:MAG: hypothetical protein JSV09_01920 [Thermoplasmata archaeon]|nr:MAG: hypothetical protein JSV09_01920 [Thermoplasmata archaeon]